MHKDPLIKSFHRARHAPPHDLFGAVKSLPPVGTLPSPWATWTLIQLVRYRSRQLWAFETLRAADIDLDDLAEAEPGYFSVTTHIVPALPGWELEVCNSFHFDFAYLRDHASGEEIFLDLSAVKDEESYFFMGSMLEHSQPWTRGAAESRMTELHPVIDTVLLARADLIESQHLEESCLDDVLEYTCERLAPHVIGSVGEIECFLEAWEDASKRLWLAALIGDWPAAAAAAEQEGNPDLMMFTKCRAEECRLRRIAHLRVQPESATPYYLGALREVSPQEFNVHVEEVLSGGGADTLAVVEFLVQYGGDSWCDQITKVFNTNVFNEDRPRNELLRHCARYLARHGRSTADVIDTIAAVEPLVAEAAFLALEYSPAQSIPLIRQGLRSPSEEVRLDIAGALAVVDRPWSHRELLSVLADFDDHELTRWPRAALLKSCDPEARQAAETWEKTHASGMSPDRCDDEAEGGNDDHSIQCYMDEWRDRALPWRDRSPE
jgi:hypothetical protein